MTRHSQTHKSVQHSWLSLFLSLTARLPPHSQDCPSLHPLQLTPLSLCHPAPQLLIIAILSLYIVLYWPLSKATYAQGGLCSGIYDVCSKRRAAEPLVFVFLLFDDDSSITDVFFSHC